MCLTGCNPSQAPRRDCNIDSATQQCADPAPWGCCQLATHIECSFPAGNKSAFTCRSGYEQRWWTCPAGALTRHCAECIVTGRSGCFDGTIGTADFACSIWWDA